MSRSKGRRKLSREAIRQKVFNNQVQTFVTEFYLVLTRRIMLSWMKDPSYVSAAIILTGVEEALIRTTKGTTRFVGK